MNKRIIPNTITSCNLLCGSIAVFLATQGAFVWAFVFILAGAFFDFFDGLSARLLKAPSPIGVELDSLADDITFGLAPAMMLFCWLKPILGWWAGIALLMAAFSALRLAKFNVDERQHDSFIGLATPANAIFWGGIYMLHAIRDGCLRLDGLVSVRSVARQLLSAECRDSVLQFQGLGKREDRDHQFSHRMCDTDRLLRNKSYSQPSY